MIDTKGRCRKAPALFVTQAGYDHDQSMLSTLVPALIKRLIELRGAVIAGKYYWANHDPRYLALVYEAALPKNTSCDALIKFYETFDKQAQGMVGSGDYFAYQAKQAVPPEKRKNKKSSADADN